MLGKVTCQNEKASTRCQPPNSRKGRHCCDRASDVADDARSAVGSFADTVADTVADVKVCLLGSQLWFRITKWGCSLVDSRRGCLHLSDSHIQKPWLGVL